MRDARRVAIVRDWLWWATFVLERRSGTGVVLAFKRAQRAIAKLNA